MKVLQRNELVNHRGDLIEVVKENKVAKVYRSFISFHEGNSLKTAKAYDDRIKEFFDLILNSEIEFVTESDVKGIERADIHNNYIDHLRWKGNSNNTIKAKLNSVRSFYNELLANNINVNPLILKFKLKDDVTHHESMTEDELNQLYEFMLNERFLALEKYLLSKTFRITADRRSELFNITWKDGFAIRNDINTGEEVNVIRVKAKGGKVRESPISKEFYNELQQLNKGQEKVFSLSEKTFERALGRFSKKINKKITIHSFKATAITLGYRSTKDLDLVRQLGNHENVLTTQKTYLREEKSLVNQLSYHSSLNDNINISDISHEDLLNIINSYPHIREGITMVLRNMNMEMKKNDRHSEMEKEQES